MDVTEHPLWCIERWDEGKQAWERHELHECIVVGDKLRPGRPRATTAKYAVLAEVFRVARQTMKIKPHLYRLRNVRTDDTVMGAIL
jgi:hypothetical protein